MSELQVKDELLRIDKETWDRFKARTEVSEDLEGALSRSLAVKRDLPKTVQAGAGVGAVQDRVDFEFDIKLLKVAGTITRSGTLDFKASVIGVEVGHTTVDLSAGNVCFNPSIGVEEVKYCFALKGNSLYTNGYVNGWFHKKQSWNVKIVSF